MTTKTCENTVSALEDMFKYLDDQDNKVEIIISTELHLMKVVNLKANFNRDQNRKKLLLDV